jgi:predicted HicB family RNase H-like nuclease
MARTFDSPRRDAPRKAAIRVRVKPSVKARAEQLAQKDGRSLADWLERLIAAEKARRDGKK